MPKLSIDFRSWLMNCLISTLFCGLFLGLFHGKEMFLSGLAIGGVISNWIAVLFFYLARKYGVEVK